MSEMLSIDVDGPIYYVDHPGPTDDAPIMVLVHGLGASNLSWYSIIPQLTGTHRVIAPDLPGFGHSAPVGRSADVRDNRDHLARFLRKLTDEPVTLVGNSMGGMITALLCHAQPNLVSAAVLLNPAIPGSLSPAAIRAADPRLAMFFALYNIPVLGEQFMQWRRGQLTSAQSVNQLLEGVTVDPSKVDPVLVELLIANAEERRGYAWSDTSFLQAERSIMRTLTFGKSTYLQQLASRNRPTLLIHGEQDRLVNVAAARAIGARSPGMDLIVLPDVGHAPQLEIPGELSGIILRWLAGAVGGRSATPQAS